MVTRIRRHLRAAASATTAVFATLVLATCLPTSAVTPEKKACCAAMEHECGETSVEMACCTSQSDQARALVATKSAAAVAFELPPVDAPVTVHTAPLVSTLAAAGRTVVKPPGSPTYLLISSLRI